MSSVSVKDAVTPDMLPTDNDRAMLRESVRGFLKANWPAGSAVAWSSDPAQLRKIWRSLSEQELTSLGSDPSQGGLREILIAAEELGRAACQAPLIASALLNLSGIAERLAGTGALDAEPIDGAPALALSFAAFDGDPAVGSAALTADGRLSGEVAFVEAAVTASYYAIFVEGPRLAIVRADAGGIAVKPLRVMGAEGLFRAELDNVPAQLIAVDAATLSDMIALSRLCHVARALGAAQRGFELAVDYARERKQFGQPIGRFQAIQHKLANCHVALRGAHLTVANAGLQYDIRNPEWRWFAAAACAGAGEALRQVSLETHHAFGAIGYSEEHEAPRHFRRTHIDLLRHGGARRARAELAEHFLGDRPRPLPEYDLGTAGNAFRHEVRAWLDSHWSGERKAAFNALPFHEREYDPAFAKDLGKTGWIGLSWPREFGGQARTALEQLALMEEMERVEAPRAGAPVQSAMLQVFGTPEQQQRYLPEILRGEAIYGMGYSEPDSGSDLASLRTRAVRDGDHYVINGQKIWTTTYWGEYMLLATRTDPDAKPQHAGLSMFIVPMDTPGITVKPSATMYDGTFANIFYDNVRVPASAMVGTLNDGWRVLTGALATERGFIGGGIVLKVAHSFELLCDYIRGAQRDGKPMRDDAIVRDRIGELAARIEAGRQMMLYCAEQIDTGETPPDDAAVSKVYSGELMERFGETALDLLGMEATLSQDSPGAILRGRIEQNLRHSLMWVISIGTNEIQRSLIAQRGLGLPR